MTRYSRKAWQAMIAASWTISRVRTSRLPCRSTSSKAKLSKVSMSSGSVIAKVETWPGKSSSWFLRARSLGAITVLLQTQQGLDRAALIHRAVTIGDIGERQCQVEHLAGIDLALQHQFHQMRQEPAHGSRTAEHVLLREEKLLTIE